MAQKKNNKMIFLIIGVSAFVIIGLVVGSYFIFFAHHRGYRGTGYVNFRRGNFTLNQSALNQTDSFFNTNPDNQSVQSYCQQNMQYCLYYCSRVNANNSACSYIPHPQFNGTYGSPMMRYTGGNTQ